ncbi:MAG: hypothetical protein Q4F97_09660 [Bacteroidales bacterium]|nr:hypothetical protein [Bacteroidales bacterium]
MDIEKAMQGGLVFKKAKEKNEDDKPQFKTKAKKSSYAKGLHGSGAAKMKAAYKKKAQNRNKK